jgi:hypothetical protein
MNTFKFVRPALLATGIASMPVAAQAQQTNPSGDVTFEQPAQVDAQHCAFAPINPASPVMTAIALTGPMVVLGKQFDKGDVIYDFGHNAEFLVHGNAITNLPGTSGRDAIAHLDTLLSLVPVTPSLVDKCGKAQKQKFGYNYNFTHAYG